GQGGPQRRGDVPVVALGDQRHQRRAGLTQRRDLRVVGGYRTRPAGRPERREGGVAELQLGAGPPPEPGGLGGRAGPSAPPEADAELVQAPRDGQLVGDGQGEAFLLGAVAQRGVVDVETVVGHWSSVLSGAARRPDKAKDPSRMREVCAPTGAALGNSGSLLRASAPADNNPAARHGPSLAQARHRTKRTSHHPRQLLPARAEAGWQPGLLPPMTLTPYGSGTSVGVV